MGGLDEINKEISEDNLDDDDDDHEDRKIDHELGAADQYWCTTLKEKQHQQQQQLARSRQIHQTIFKNNDLPSQIYKDDHEKETDFDEYTRDGSLDSFDKPARKGKTGGWKSGMLLLVHQGLATLAPVVVEVNLVLYFSTRLLEQNNAEVANTFSRWMGTTYLFYLLGVFVCDFYLGRYLTCAIFQMVFTLGLAVLSLTNRIPH